MTTQPALPATPPAAARHSANAAVLPPVAPIAASSGVAPLKRISSASLMDGRREVEIEHGGKIYRLRVTQLNKLILTA